MQILKAELETAQEEILRLKKEIAQKSADKYHSIFNSIEEAFCIYEIIYDNQNNPIDLLWLEVNTAYERQTGLKDIIGKLASNVIPRTETYWLELYDKAAKTGEPMHVEYWHNPTQRWYHVYSSRIGDIDSKQVVILFSDITKRKNAEDRQTFLLKLSDALRPIKDPAEIQKIAMKLLAEQLNVMRAAYFEVGANQDTFELTAHYEDNALPMPNRMCLSDFSPDMATQYRMGNTLMVEETEHEPLREAYQAIGIRAWAAVPLVKNKLLVAIVGVHSKIPRKWTKLEIQLLEDLAERTWAAVERAAIEMALRESEQRLGLAIEIGEMASWDWDMRSNEVKWNDRHFLMQGYAVGEVTPSYEAWLARVHPEHREEAESLINQARDTKAIYIHEFRTLHPDGSIRWCSARGRFFYDNAGKPFRMIGVIEDITQRKQTEVALRESEQQLKQLLKLRDEFIGIASHELNTPVTSMKIYADIVQKKMEETQDGDNIELLTRLNTQIDRLSSLITILLDTTRIAEGQLKLHPEPVDINELVHERIAEISHTSKHKWMFKTQDIPHVIADKERIGQVITNLLSNAIKYSQQDTTITICVTLENKNIKISVQDEGYGIPEKDISQIFNRFFRVTTNTMYTYPGMGLGLYIAAQIIERHEGKISVKSQEGVGSIFAFTLPRG